LFHGDTWSGYTGTKCDTSISQAVTESRWIQREHVIAANLANSMTDLKGDGRQFNTHYVGRLRFLEQREKHKKV